MKKIILLSLLLISSFMFCQESSIEWQKSLGGLGNDFAYSVQQTADGGYIVAGYSRSNNGDVSGNNGDNDYWVVKLDVLGNITWQTSLGGTGDDRAKSIQQTTDGGYIVAGYSYSSDGDVTGNNGSYDYWVVKLDAVGNITWQTSLGGTGDDRAESIQQTTDGGYIVVGQSVSNDGDVTENNGGNDFWVIKLDTVGNITWQTSLGGSSDDASTSVQQTTDGGYIVAGSSNSNDGDLTGNNGGNDYWVVKLDATGNITWQTPVGGSLDDKARSIQQTVDGGYIVAGYSQSNDGDVTGNNGGWDYWVVKLDAHGNITWQKSLGGSENDRAYSIQQAADGGYIFAGDSESNDGDITGNNGGYDYWVVKIDVSGNITWEISLGGTKTDWLNSIQQTVNGGYILVGGSYSYNGDVTGNNGLIDFWVVKLSPEASLKENEILRFNAYPNPTTKTFTISSDKVISSAFKIIDAQGNEVLSGNMNGKEETIDISNLSNGVYSVMFDNSELPVLSVIKE